jgi:hypothetical protein
MTLDVTVSISQIKTAQEPPSTSVEFVVCNDSAAPVWLVNDQWLIWHQAGQEIELGFQRGAMRPGSHVFGYFPPTVTKIEPGSSHRRAVELRWPQPLDLLWNNSERAAPPPGLYQVSVRVGYGLTPEPESPKLGESVEAPVLKWQCEAVSQPVPMEVPAYPV